MQVMLTLCIIALLHYIMLWICHKVLSGCHLSSCVCCVYKCGQHTFFKVFFLSNIHDQPVCAANTKLYFRGLRSSRESLMLWCYGFPLWGWITLYRGWCLCLFLWRISEVLSLYLVLIACLLQSIDGTKTVVEADTENLLWWLHYMWRIWVHQPLQWTWHNKSNWNQLCHEFSQGTISNPRKSFQTLIRLSSIYISSDSDLSKQGIRILTNYLPGGPSWK